jgi:hypothetical protein
VATNSASAPSSNLPVLGGPFEDEDDDDDDEEEEEDDDDDDDAAAAAVDDIHNYLKLYNEGLVSNPHE